KHRIGRAAARASGVAELAARARVHRRDELERGRELGVARGARDDDAAGLERLAQRLERSTRELGQLVEEEDTVVRERDLARTRRRAAADERGCRCGVVRRAQHALAPASGVE